MKKVCLLLVALSVIIPCYSAQSSTTSSKIDGPYITTYDPINTEEVQTYTYRTHNYYVYKGKDAPQNTYDPSKLYRTHHKHKKVNNTK